MLPSIITPESRTILAIDFLAPVDSAGRLELALKTRLETAVQFSSVIQIVRKPAGGKLVLLLPHSGIPLLPFLRTVVTVLDKLEHDHSDTCQRLLVHQGLVFLQDSRGQSLYMGSGVRAAQALLQRCPANSIRAITPAFNDTIASWLDVDITTTTLAGAASRDRLQQFVFSVAPAAASPKKEERGALTRHHLATITRRLAEYVGPIAPSLVDNASTFARSDRDLMRMLSEEIDNPDERKHFIRDVQRLLQEPAVSAFS